RRPRRGGQGGGGGAGARSRAGAGAQRTLATTRPRPVTDDRSPPRGGKRMRAKSSGGGDRSGPAGQRTRPADAPALALAHAAPDAELLAVGQRVLEARLADHAAPADLLGLTRGRTPLGEEKVGVDPEAVGLVL